jgi:hypothetical protein
MAQRPIGPIICILATVALFFLGGFCLACANIGYRMSGGTEHFAVPLFGIMGVALWLSSALLFRRAMAAIYDDSSVRILGATALWVMGGLCLVAARIEFGGSHGQGSTIYWILAVGVLLLLGGVFVFRTK